jgi:hypothetical protein
LIDMIISFLTIKDLKVMYVAGSLENLKKQL